MICHFDPGRNAENTDVTAVGLAGSLRQIRPLNVVISGGGPTALIFALMLHHLMQGMVRITIYETRWVIKNGEVHWAGLEDGNRRRKQVVTFQSMVWDRLPGWLIALVFSRCGFSEIWPVGPESPSGIGYPRNIKICDLEDRLLAAARQTPIVLIPGAFDAHEADLEAWDLVVCADGAGSRTRTHFQAQFGPADTTRYSLEGEQVIDTILAIRVNPHLRDVDMVPLTVAQNRFLYNGMGGPDREGYLYMRLTRNEATEAFGLRSGHREACTQRNPAVPDSSAGVVFAPAVDPGSLLWPRVLDGLALFGMSADSILDMSCFELSMVSRPRAVADLTAPGTSHATFGALLGDAASALHFWPGRGLASGASMAAGLAQILAKQWNGRALRSADLTLYEAVFAALKHRHGDRAWRAMVQFGDAKPQPIQNVIAKAITRDDSDREELLHEMTDRITSIVARLQPRMPDPINEQAALANLSAVSTETLRVLVASQPWDGWASGGPEVDVTKLVG